MKNNRRKFFKSIGLAAAGAVVTGLHSKKSKASDKIKWKMVTSWPKNFPGLGTGAQRLVNSIKNMSEGRLNIKLFAIIIRHSTINTDSSKSFKHFNCYVNSFIYNFEFFFIKTT